MSDPIREPDDKSRYTSNLALAAVSGQVGCLTLVIIFVALLAGLWLDNAFQTRPLFTIILLIASVPVDVIAMLWVVRKATGKIKSVPKNKS